MVAYVIVEVDVRDPQRYARYREMVPASLAAHGGRFLARGGEVVPLEGDWHPPRVVVLEFDDVESARRWWSSEEYREAKALRQATARTRAIIVEGV